MQLLRLKNQSIYQGWKLVRNKDKSDIVKKSHYISVEMLKTKMEENIETVVCKMVESVHERRKENDIRDCHMDGIWEYRKRKLIMDDEWETQKLNPNVDLETLPGSLKAEEEHRLRIVCSKLTEAIYKLELLLLEADKENITEDIPEATHANCVDALSTANNIYLRIEQAISQKKEPSIEDNFAAGEKTLTRVKAMAQLLKATMNALKDA